jgi:hypothetical protein
MELEAPQAPQIRKKRSVFARLLGVGGTKEDITSRRIQVRNKDPEHICESIQTTKEFDFVGSSHPTIDSKSAQKLREKLGLLQEKKSIKYLYTQLLEQANEDADIQANAYEEEQNAYEEEQLVYEEEARKDKEVHQERQALDKGNLFEKNIEDKKENIVDFKESEKSVRVSLQYPIKEKIQKPKMPVQKEQKIEVEVDKEGTYTSTGDSFSFIPVHHDPQSYDWSSEEGYIQKTTKKKSSAVKKSVNKNSSAVKKSVKKKSTASISSKFSTKKSAKKAVKKIAKKTLTKTTKKKTIVGAKKKASSKKSSSKKKSNSNKKRTTTMKRTTKTSSAKKRSRV